ncbi:exported hypothetical protein [Candidatus Sulfotelmatomonas gaucii]|uniref:Uncharacterized protein n=1 Tax=Candidatus Sulfuritelmatomonas gaucii TaxID=2043161 RepID=A0A2N9L3X9_9BACT|nr:exported hypothetical protein [Candidatus Sulfotelmatomonas gaucii]
MQTIKAVASVLLFGFFMIATAQQKPLPKSAARPGIISGRVFLITGGGDLKPARMAAVYALYLRPKLGNDAAGNEIEQHSACLTWAQNLAQKQEAETAQYKALPLTVSGSMSEAALCRRGLLVYQNALVDTLKWASSENKDWQIVRADADEDGAFKVAIRRPGVYTLLVRGHAGFNDAFWESGPLTVTPGGEIAVKLSSPEESCLPE